MLRPDLEEIVALMKRYGQSFLSKGRVLQSKIGQFVRSRVVSWWQVFLIVVGGVVFLYYPLGGLMVHHIDTTPNIRKETVEDGRMLVLDMASLLINREVHHKIWTPNLPFLFPSYFLDNMPAFQKGIMSAVVVVVSVFDDVDANGVSEDVKKELDEAIKLLRYPPDVWLFSPKNKLVPVPSSSTQYKKGRKKLNNYNAEIAKGKLVVLKNEQNLALVLQGVAKDLLKSQLRLEKHVMEHSRSVIDVKADEEFYFAQGKGYAYSQLLRDLGKDFKEILVAKDVYQDWTSMLRALRMASDLNPSIVRNAKPNSSFAPNHLLVINYYMAAAVERLNGILGKLSCLMEK